MLILIVNKNLNLTTSLMKLKLSIFFYLIVTIFFGTGTSYVYSQDKVTIELLEKRLAAAKADTTKVTMFYNLAEAYQPINSKLFEYNMNKGVALANKLNFTKGKIAYLNSKAYFALTTGNPKLGSQFAHKAAAISLASKDTLSYLKNSYYEAASFMYLGDYNQLIDHVNVALDVIKGRPFYADRGVLYSLLVQYYSRTDLAKAFEYIVLEYDCLKVKQKPNEMFSVYNEFAGYYLTVLDYKESISYSKKALEQANKIVDNKQYNVALAMSNLSNVFLIDNQFQEAFVYAAKSMKISKNIQNQALISKNNLLLAEIYLNQKKYDTALPYCLQGIEGIELPENILKGQLFMAWGLNGLNKFKEAQNQLAKVDVKLLAELSPNLQMVYYKEQSNSNKALGNFAKAFENTEILNQIQNQFFEDKGSIKTLMLQSKFQLREKNYELEKLTLDKQKVELQNQKQATNLNLLLASAILLIFFISILIWAYQFRKKGNFIFGLSRLQLQNSVQEKEVLVKEIHHRVKNNFQLISSMMSIQAVNKDIGIDEFISVTKSRIITLSKIHEQLYLKDNLYQLDANEYVKELAENVKISFSDIATQIEFQFSDEVVILDLETLIPLGLIINELLLNSYKHAFPQRQEGIIEVKVLLFEKNKYQLIYSDNGVGLQEANTNQKSVGMNLINALCKQLRSEPDFHFEGGSHFEIIFKKIKYKN